MGAGLSQTLDLGPQKTLLNREREFVSYAPDFNKQAVQFASNPQPFVSNNASTMSSKISRASPRGITRARSNRWDPKVIGQGPEDPYDDLNDRETADNETINSPGAI